MSSWRYHLEQYRWLRQEANHLLAAPRLLTLLAVRKTFDRRHPLFCMYELQVAILLEVHLIVLRLTIAPLLTYVIKLPRHSEISVPYRTNVICEAEPCRKHLASLLPKCDCPQRPAMLVESPLG